VATILIIFLRINWSSCWLWII